MGNCKEVQGEEALHLRSKATLFVRQGCNPNEFRNETAGLSEGEGMNAGLSEQAARLARPRRELFLLCDR